MSTFSRLNRLALLSGAVAVLLASLTAAAVNPARAEDYFADFNRQMAADQQQMMLNQMQEQTRIMQRQELQADQRRMDSLLNGAGRRNVQVYGD